MKLNDSGVVVSDGFPNSILYFPQQDIFNWLHKFFLRQKAVEKDDVNTLRKLSDGTNVWYKLVNPFTGNTFLHDAVFNKSKDVFDYLLSFPDCPLDVKNEKGATPLKLSLTDTTWSPVSQLFACELIKRGASPKCISLGMRETLLHYTVRNKMVLVSCLLMHMGYEVDAEDSNGVTPLRACCKRPYPGRPTIQIAEELLSRNPDLTKGRRLGYNDFEYLVICEDLLPPLADTLLHWITKRKGNLRDIHLETLLVLATKKLDLFHATINCVEEVIVEKCSSRYLDRLFWMDEETLQILIMMCPDALREVLSEDRFESLSFDIFSSHPFLARTLLENLNVLLESDLRDATTDFMLRVNDQLLTALPAYESQALQHVCFFLSYGLKLNEYVLNQFYEKFGPDGRLMKMALHVEIEFMFSKHYYKYPQLMLLYDLHWNLKRIVNNVDKYEGKFGTQLLQHFSDEQLRKSCANDSRLSVVARIFEQPKVPLLLELARNIFRTHLIRVFSVKSAGLFKVLVDRLPIASVHKQMITYEMALY